LVFPESATEKKIANLISEYSEYSKNEVEKQYFSIKNNDTHYGTLYKTLDNNGKNVYFGTNFTKAETTFSRKNIELTEKSLLVKPYLWGENLSNLYDSTIVLKPNDIRLIFDEFNIQELLVLSSI